MYIIRVCDDINFTALNDLRFLVTLVLEMK